MTICHRWPIPMGYATQNIPAGYVVVANVRSPACPYYNSSGDPNALTIRTPASPTTICLRWPIPLGYTQQNIPSGYVVVSASRSTACAYYNSSGDPNALTIATPTSPTTICHRWPIPMGYVTQNIPAGYVVTANVRTAACPYYSPSGDPNALTIRPPASPITICLRWPIPLGYSRQNIPSGYVVVSASRSTECAYYSASGDQNALTITTPTSGITICMRWPIPMGYVSQSIPPGYVLTSTVRSSGCPYYSSTGSPNAYVIRKV